MEWRVLLVLLFAVSFSFALPTGQLDTEENEDQDFADFEDAQEELEDFPDVEEDQEDYPVCKDSKPKYWCIAQKYKCSSYSVYKYCQRTCGRCPRDGNWSPYGPYSKCSKYCGGGKQYRYRTCSKPSPAYGGKKCPGLPKQSRDCNKQHCPVNGGWSEWGNWGMCSVSCDGGSQSRSRTCTNPSPAYGGKGCKGPSTQTRGCNKQHCPVPGGWTPWSPWSKCSRTCGPGGSQTRKRSCTNPPPAYGGNKCEGVSSQTRKCPVKYVPCPCHDKKSKYYCSGVAKRYECGKYYTDCRKTCNKCHYKG